MHHAHTVPILMTIDTPSFSISFFHLRIHCFRVSLVVHTVSSARNDEGMVVPCVGVPVVALDHIKIAHQTEQTIISRALACGNVSV